MFSRLASTFDSLSEKMQSVFQPRASASAAVSEDFDFVSDAVNDFADRIGSVLDRGTEMISALSPKKICESISKRVASIFSSNKVDSPVSAVSATSRSVAESVVRTLQTPAHSLTSVPAKGRLDNVRLELPSLRRREIVPMGHAPGKTYGGMFRVQMAPTTSQIVEHDPLSPFHQFGRAGLMDETPIFNQDPTLLDERSMFHQSARELLEGQRYYDHLAVLDANAYRDMLPATPALDSAPQSKRMWLGTAAEAIEQREVRAPVAPPAVFQAPAPAVVRKPRVRGVDDLFGDFWMKTNAQGVAI